MDAPQYELLALQGSDEIGRWSLVPGCFTVGRSPDCSIQLEAGGVADEHAQLSVNEDGSIILEVGPAGATLEGSPVAGAVRIQPDQYIDLGSVSLILQTPSGSQNVSLAEEPQDEMPPEFRHAKRYEIGQEIARGGMGAILQARQSTIRRAVAMKVILARAEEDPWQRLRFIEEAQITGQLEHPNIVPVHDAGIDGQGRIYYTMKLVKGITLKKVLELLKKEEAAAAAKYSLLTLLTIYQKVCDAVAFAHSRGVIHRDLKPENIMIGAYGEVLVMDWGLGRLFRQRVGRGSAVAEEMASARFEQGDEYATMPGTIMGTPAYMAPEQARGELDRLDPRTDIFALGVILYEILTLARPFAGKNGSEILESIRSARRPILPTTFHARGNQATGRPRLLHLNQSAVPASLSAVAMRALEHRAEDRYQKVEALQADLTAYQNGFATSAEKAGAWKQVKLLIKRNKAAALGMAAVLLVGATLGTKAVFEARRATRGEALAQREGAKALFEARRAERGEALAQRESAAAKATLADLRRTAPVFFEQAKIVFSDGKIDEAIQKSGYAIELDGENADYRLFRAHLRQSSLDLAGAAEDYRQVLLLRPDDAAARTNLALCEKLLAETGGAPMGPPQQLSLFRALRAQNRLLESAPLVAVAMPEQDRQRAAERLAAGIPSTPKPLPASTPAPAIAAGTPKRPLTFTPVRAAPDPEAAAAQAVLLARLHQFHQRPRWWDTRVAILPDGTLSLNLNNMVGGDLSCLQGQRISVLDLSFDGVTDLQYLAGLPLKELNLGSARATDLSPLSGMPLETLKLESTTFDDFSPLRGMKLRVLVLRLAHVEDLSPLAGMPLVSLDLTYNSLLRELEPLRGAPLEELLLERTGVESLAPLAGMPLKHLRIDGTKVSDLSPLLKCPNLEEIVLPEGDIDVSVLRKLPKLIAISTRAVAGGPKPGGGIRGPKPAQTAEEFWKQYDAKHPRAAK
jgi:serine/threonine protein kinase